MPGVASFRLLPVVSVDFAAAQYSSAESSDSEIGQRAAVCLERGEPAKGHCPRCQHDAHDRPSKVVAVHDTDLCIGKEGRQHGRSMA
jgi:hypothetical protein